MSKGVQFAKVSNCFRHRRDVQSEIILLSLAIMPHLSDIYSKSIL